ncbi:MAG: hypothetical protein AB8B82_06845 [Roseovarius sp.]
MPFDQTTYTETLAASDTTDDKTMTRRLWAFAAVLVGLWGTSIAMFGIPGLYLPAVALVPCVMVMLIRLTRG